MKPTGTCATNQYIKQINADGSVVCGNVPYHWGVTCSVGQYIERIASNGTPTCKSITGLVGNVTCGAGEAVYKHVNGTLSCRSIGSSISNQTCSSDTYMYKHSNGTLTCRSDKNVFGKSCSNKQTLRGFTKSGDPICDCKGTTSASCSGTVTGNLTVTGSFRFDSDCNVQLRLEGNNRDSGWVNDSSISLNIGGSVPITMNRNSSRIRVIGLLNSIICERNL